MKKAIIIFFSILILFSCQNRKKESISIGVILPLTGPVATYGQDLKKGIDIAFESNKRFKVIYEDDKASASTGISSMKKLQNVDNAKFFIGCATTTVTLAIAQEAQRTNSLLMVPIATGDQIKNIGDLIFMNSPRNEKQAISAFNFAYNKLNKDKIGIIYQQNSYGTGLSSVFIEEMRKVGLEPLFSESYQDARTQVRGIISKIKNMKPEVVFVPAEYEPTSIVLKQAKELGLETIFIGTDGAYSSKLIELAKEASENFYLTMFPLKIESIEYKDFEENYFNKFNSEPNVFTCYGFNTASVLLKAINAARIIDVGNVKDYLLSSTFNSLSGEISFDEYGEVNLDYGIYKVIDSQFIILNP